MGFGRGGGYNSESDQDKEIIHARVATIKGAPEKGKKRVVVKTKTGMRKAIGIDLAAKDAAKIKRKKDYTFKVKEKSDDRYGGRPKAGGFKTYDADEAPKEYERKPDNAGFKQFGENSNMKGKSSRTKF
jgi:hypothetical protein